MIVPKNCFGCQDKIPKTKMPKNTNFVLKFDQLIFTSIIVYPSSNYRHASVNHNTRYETITTELETRLTEQI